MTSTTEIVTTTASEAQETTTKIKVCEEGMEEAEVPEDESVVDCGKLMDEEDDAFNVDAENFKDIEIVINLPEVLFVN